MIASSLRRCLCWPRTNHRRLSSDPHSTRRHASNSVSDDARKRIYVWGSTNKGRWIVANLRSRPDPPPVTLLVNTLLQLEAYEKNGHKFFLLEDGGRRFEITGFEVEVIKRDYFYSKSFLPVARFLNLHSVRMEPHYKSLKRNELISSLKSPRNSASRGSKRNKTKSPVSNNKSREYAPVDLQGLHESEDTNAAPIINLISTASPENFVDFPRSMVERLGRNSTILTFQNTLGILETVYDRFFPHSIDRPTFRIGVESHCVWEDHAGKTWLDYTIGYSPDLLNLNFKSAVGHLKIGPPVLARDESSPPILSRRRATSDYLIQQLLQCSELRVRQVNPRTILVSLVKKVIVRSILEVLSAISEEPLVDVFNTDSSRIVASRLIQEVYSVLQKCDIPEIQPSMLVEWIKCSLNNFSGDDLKSPMLGQMCQRVMNGHSPHTEWYNGWFVKKAKEVGIGSLSANENAIRILVEKATLRGLEIDDELQERRKAGRRSCIGDSSRSETVEDDIKADTKRGSHTLPNTTQKEGRPEIDRLEHKRLKKEQRQRANLGKQEVPAYHAPDIASLGNSALIQGNPDVKIRKYQSTGRKPQVKIRKINSTSDDIVKADSRSAR
jgi:ketopantoate reductase